VYATLPALHRAEEAGRRSSALSKLDSKKDK